MSDSFDHIPLGHQTLGFTVVSAGERIAIAAIDDYPGTTIEIAQSLLSLCDLYGYPGLRFTVEGPIVSTAHGHIRFGDGVRVSARLRKAAPRWTA